MPVYHDDPEPYQTFYHENPRALMPRHEVYPELTRKYREDSAR